MRYAILDRIRGITLISMILYHAIWDLVYLYGAGWEWYRGKPGYLWQQSICWTFILLSGFCSSLGKRKVRRGIIVLAAGTLVTAVTVVAMPESQIIFGVLTFLGSAMLFMAFMHKIFRKTNQYAGLIVTLVLFFVTSGVNHGYLGWRNIFLMELPDYLYKNLFTTYFGFVGDGFFSTDYFSLLPWIFLFIAGYYLYRIAEAKGVLQRWQKYPQKVPSPFLAVSWMGRHSLIIYLLHQPVVFAVLYICSLFFT